MADREGFYPGRPLIDAYGNGGFRFAGMSHRGSLLMLPSGVHAWQAATPDAFDRAAFARVIAEVPAIEVLLLGTGAHQVFLSSELAAYLGEAGLGVEPMSTGAACRTYNVLLAEGRRVGAALIAVD